MTTLLPALDNLARIKDKSPTTANVMRSVSGTTSGPKFRIHMDNRFSQSQRWI